MSGRALAPGHEILWYRIDEVLGQGGFGITYLAHDNNLDRAVAIKEFLPVSFAYRHRDFSVKPVTGEHREHFAWGLESFLKEAKTLARFSHENIVQVHSVFEANHTAYMVMAYEQGEPLNRIYKRGGGLSQAFFEGVFFPIMDGLQAIHALGFLHRDIKPSNIYLRANGTPVLLDFGSARQRSDDGGSEMTSLVSHGYTPLEQYSATYGEQGPWTDIYALGASFHEGICRERPAEALTRSAARLRQKPDPLRALAPAGQAGFDRSFLAAIDSALRLEPENRPQSLEAWRATFGVADFAAVGNDERVRDETATILLSSLKDAIEKHESATAGNGAADELDDVWERFSEPSVVSARPRSDSQRQTGDSFLHMDDRNATVSRQRRLVLDASIDEEFTRVGGPARPVERSDRRGRSPIAEHTGVRATTTHRARTSGADRTSRTRSSASVESRSPTRGTGRVGEERRVDDLATAHAARPRSDRFDDAEAAPWDMTVLGRPLEPSRRPRASSDRPSADVARVRHGFRVLPWASLVAGIVLVGGGVAWWLLAAGIDPHVVGRSPTLDSLPTPATPVDLRLPREAVSSRLDELGVLANAYRDMSNLDDESASVARGAARVGEELVELATRWHASRHPEIARRIERIADALPVAARERDRIIGLLHGDTEHVSTDRVLAGIESDEILRPAGESVFDLAPALSERQWRELRASDRWVDMLERLQSTAFENVAAGDFDTAARLTEVALTIDPENSTFETLAAHLRLDRRVR